MKVRFSISVVMDTSISLLPKLGVRGCGTIYTHTHTFIYQYCGKFIHFGGSKSMKLLQTNKPAAGNCWLEFRTYIAILSACASVCVCALGGRELPLHENTYRSSVCVCVHGVLSATGPTTTTNVSVTM